MTSRIGGSAGSPNGSVQSSTPFASIMRSATFGYLSASTSRRVTANASGSPFQPDSPPTKPPW